MLAFCYRISRGWQIAFIIIIIILIDIFIIISILWQPLAIQYFNTAKIQSYLLLKLQNVLLAKWYYSNLNQTTTETVFKLYQVRPSLQSSLFNSIYLGMWKD